jgi:hypothetical protein
LDKKPFSITPGLAKNTLVYIFSYAGTESDFDTDKAAYFAELKKHFLYDQTVGIYEFGLGLTGSTEITVSDAATAVTIETATVSADITAETAAYPVVFWKGNAIPFSDYASVVTAQGLITLIAGTTAIYGTNEDDFEVWYSDHLWAINQGISAGGVSMPIETNEYSSIGHDESVYKVVKRGDQESSGSITVVEDLTSIMMASDVAPLNNAGSELLARIYGTDWNADSTVDAPNILTPPTNPFGVCIVMLSGNRLHSADVGKVWGSVQHIFHCKVTNIGEPQNITGDATDPILRTVEFESYYGRSGLGEILCLAYT